MRGDGRVYLPFRRGKFLPNWHLAYWANGREIRESSHTSDKAAAETMLRARISAKKRGRIVDDNLVGKFGSQGNKGVYFIQSVNGGPIKIGHAQNVYHRMTALQIAVPEKLRCLGITLGVGIREEKRLHRFFADARIRGEWFRPTPALLRWISVNSSPPRGGRRFLLGAEGESLSEARLRAKYEAEEAATPDDEAVEA